MGSNVRQRVAVAIARSARKDLDDLPRPRISRQVRETIDRLVAELRAGRRPQDMRNIQGRPDTHRIDSGEYRILFTLEPGEVVVLGAGSGEDAFTIEQAAEELGVAEGAVRERIRQGKLTMERGRVLTIFHVRNRAQAYRNL